jgi:GNAT superfamily N-acetyltransferase
MIHQQIDISPVKVQEMLIITRMTFTNMAGADRYFTKITRNPISRWITYISLPIYLGYSGQGYKALIEGRLVGCAFIHLRVSSAYVFNVSVNQPYRRQGVGRRLMDHLETLTREQDLSWMVLQVDDGNHPAQHLYEQTGYRPYNPEFLRHEGDLSLNGISMEGLHLEQLSSYSGRSLFKRYTNIEQQTGDLWVAPVLDDYNLGPHSGGAYWRCVLDDKEVGSAWVSNRYGRLKIELACKPQYWGHHSLAGLIWLLLDASPSGTSTIDIYFGSSAHYAAATSQLHDYGFGPRRQQRILMFKTLD